MQLGKTWKIKTETAKGEPSRSSQNGEAIASQKVRVSPATIVVTKCRDKLPDRVEASIHQIHWNYICNSFWKRQSCRIIFEWWHMARAALREGNRAWQWLGKSLCLPQRSGTVWLQSPFTFHFTEDDCFSVCYSAGRTQIKPSRQSPDLAVSHLWPRPCWVVSQWTCWAGRCASALFLRFETSERASSLSCCFAQISTSSPSLCTSSSLKFSKTAQLLTSSDCIAEKGTAPIWESSTDQNLGRCAKLDVQGCVWTMLLPVLLVLLHHYCRS